MIFINSSCKCQRIYHLIFGIPAMLFGHQRTPAIFWQFFFIPEEGEKKMITTWKCVRAHYSNVVFRLVWFSVSVSYIVIAKANMNEFAIFSPSLFNNSNCVELNRWNNVRNISCNRWLWQIKRQRKARNHGISVGISNPSFMRRVWASEHDVTISKCAHNACSHIHSGHMLPIKHPANVHTCLEQMYHRK